MISYFLSFDEAELVEPFDRAAMTTSSGLGPANGSVVVWAAVAEYGNVKMEEGCRLVGGCEWLLNIVLAKADGVA